MRNLIHPIMMALLGFLCWVGVSASSLRAETLLDEVVGSVNSAAITRSQVIFETRFILVEKGQPWSGGLPAELLERVLQRLIGKTMIYQEMARTGYLRTEDELRREGAEPIAAFKQSFVSQQDYQRFLRAVGMSEEGLEGVIRLNLRIDTFIQRRLEMLARVTDEDVLAEIRVRKEDGRLARDAVENDREIQRFIREQLEKSRKDESLAKWLADLEARNTVRVLQPFTRDEPPAVSVFPDQEVVP